MSAAEEIRDGAPCGNCGSENTHVCGDTDDSIKCGDCHARTRPARVEEADEDVVPRPKDGPEVMEEAGPGHYVGHDVKRDAADSLGVLVAEVYRQAAVAFSSLVVEWTIRVEGPAPFVGVKLNVYTDNGSLGRRVRSYVWPLRIAHERVDDRQALRRYVERGVRELRRGAGKGGDDGEA